jgi:putative GTP pyrophosphokinase
MPDEISVAQVDRLGERLRRIGLPTPTDVEYLDAYRLTFQPAYQRVVDIVRATAGADPTGRPGKSTPSIIDKLQRETMRLSQMQDIAGCRVVVTDVSAQDSMLERLRAELEQVGGVKVVDRRRASSHGYRAIHLIVTVGDKPVEVQLRTQYQHLWAELSEEAADLFGIQVKYGGEAPGKPEVRSSLDALSQLFAELESGAPQAELPDRERVVQAVAVVLAVVVASANITRKKL